MGEEIDVSEVNRATEAQEEAVICTSTMNYHQEKAMDGNAQEGETSSNHVESLDASESNGSNYVAHVKKLINHKMLVGIKDGRFFLGMFYCMDKQGNIILQDAVEYRNTRRFSPSPMEHRGVGLILLPFSCRTSCHVDCSIDEQLSLLSLQEKNSRSFCW